MTDRKICPPFAWYYIQSYLFFILCFFTKIKLLIIVIKTKPLHLLFNRLQRRAAKRPAGGEGGVAYIKNRAAL